MKSIALVAYGERHCWAHHDSIQTARVTVARTRAGAGILDQVRNVLLEQAMSMPDVDVMVWIDSDISFDRAGYDHLVESCRQTRGIVGAPYVTKEIKPKLVGLPAAGIEEIHCYEGGQLYPAHTVGMGFTAMHRDAIAKMAAGVPRIRMVVVEVECAPLFSQLVLDGNLLHEDYSFCARARAAGVPIHLDTRPKIGHHGEHMFQLEDSAGFQRATSLLLKVPKEGEQS